MLRVALLLILVVVGARAFWRLVDGIIEGLSTSPGGNIPDRGMQMVRDPVCGMFITRDRAVTLGEGARQRFFCSPRCRDQYLARPSVA